MVSGSRIPVLERVLTIDPRNGLALVRLGKPRHVLAETLFAAADEPDERRHAREAAGDRLLQSLELVRLDCERKARDSLP